MSLEVLIEANRQTDRQISIDGEKCDREKQPGKYPQNAFMRFAAYAERVSACACKYRT